jgi:hypothetical protein
MEKEENMRNKIVGIMVCMLVIATAIPAVTSVKNNAIDATTPKTAQTSMAGIWTEKQKILAPDGTAKDEFGLIALDGDTAIMTAWLDDDNGVDSGSAYVFTHNGTDWTMQQKLLALEGTTGDRFGSIVALDGDTAIITAVLDDDNGIDSGSAYVFTRNGNTWTQQAKLLPSDGEAGDLFGCAVSLSGDTAFIGAQWDDDNGVDSGSVYVFTRSGTTWTQQQKLLAPDGAAEDLFGWWVDLDGDTVLIAAKWDDDNGDGSGSAYVFTRTGTTWAFQQKLLASDGAPVDRFGVDVALDGDTAFIAACYDDDMGTDSGSVYVFTRTGTTWTEQQKLTASDGSAGDSFGGCAGTISLDGDTAIIGAWLDKDNGDQSGSAYVFTRTEGIWKEQQKLLASDGAENDLFSSFIALDGDTAMIWAWLDDDNGLDSGSVYVFTKVGLTVGVTGGLGVKAVITNEGTIYINNVPWWIHVEGGMLGLINKTMNGTINIDPGETIPVGKMILFGFGPITITVKVADEEQIVTGTQLIIFSMVKK